MTDQRTAGEPAARGPAWTNHILANVCHNDGLFARILAAMPWDQYVAATTWGNVATIWGWHPPYLRASPRMGAEDRADRARGNRAMACTPAHILRADGRVVLVLQPDGAWRTADEANQGGDLISLAQWRWGCRYGQACARIARAAGLTLPGIQRDQPAGPFRFTKQELDRIAAAATRTAEAA